MLWVLGWLALIGLCVLPHSALAQNAPASPGAQRSVEDRIEGLQSKPSASAAGDEGLIVLRPNKLFTAQIYSSYRFTNNAFLSNDLREDDRILEQSASLSAATRIAERVDAFATAGIFSGRYADNSEIDYDGFYGELGATLPVRAASSLVLSYSPAIAFDRGFDRQSLTLHKFRARLQTSYLIAGRVGLYPFFSVSRTFADPADFRQVTGRLGADIAYAPRANLYTFGTLEAAYTQYDEFFESFTGEERRDTILGVSAGLSWSPTHWVTSYFMLSAKRLWSSVRSNTYDEISAAPSVSLYVQF